MRVSFWKHLKWLVACYFWYWSFLLIRHEATPEMLEAYNSLGTAFRNKANARTARMQTETDK